MTSAHDGDDVPQEPSASGVHVSCRLRGLSATERAAGRRDAVQVDASDSHSVVAASAAHAFRFNHVFSPTASQDEIFATIGRPCVHDVIQGYNCTLLAYGQTGSGKTHTTIGSDDEDGLVPRMVEYLFTALADDPDATVTASFLEVYQERLRDLLLPRGTSTLRIREDKDVGVWVDGATEISLLDLATASAALRRGLVHRAVGTTQLNRDSSRSHAVFAVTLTRATTTGDRVRARLCVVDLAGSEQAKKTQASGARLDEAKHINRSLSALGNVIYALTSTNSRPAYVPYRDSKLTRLLQSSLGGNAKTYLLLTCATACCHTNESLSTLRFGARATRMRNKPTVNVNKAMGASAPEVLETLQRKIESLCRYIRELEDAAASSASCSCGAGVPKELTEDDPMVETADAMDDVEATTNEPTSSDLLMQAELVTLRKALDDMHRLQRHETLHAQSLQATVDGVAHSEMEKRVESQAREIELLEMQLTAAESEIANLQRHLREQRDRDSQLQNQLSRFESQQRRDDDASSAETEILRRRLEHSDKQLQSVHTELAASRAESATLRLLVEQSEQERMRMREELESVRQELTAVALPTPKSVPKPSVSPPRSLGKPVLRPVTVANAPSSGAIQSWWAGNTHNNNCEDVDAMSAGRCSTSMAAPRPRLAALEETDDRSQQLHTSGGMRPFRARLVGLLNTLEAETTSYKELLQGDSTTGDDDAVAGVPRPRPAHARCHTRRHHSNRLPELSAASIFEET